MKTPNDLTQEQKEILGLYTDIGNGSYKSLPHDNGPLFVNAKLDAELHSAGIEFHFTIWQNHGLVGSNQVKGISTDAMICAFDFVWDLAHLERYNKNTEMIDALLLVLAKIQEKLAQ